MPIPDANKLVDEAVGLGRAMFDSPLWDADEKKWRRRIDLDSGQVDASQHFYYDICNIYALARAMALSGQMERFREGWLQAVGWLFWLVNSKGAIGYTSFDVTGPRDQYSFALAPAALAEAHRLTGRPALLRKAGELFGAYRAAFPLGKVRNVQASNHFILSALSLYRAAGQAAYLEAAQAEAEHLLAACRLAGGPAAGCFTDDQRLTAFPRHVYATWALVELNHLRPDQRLQQACAQSMDWWRANQLADGGFYFFFDGQTGQWVDQTVYSVHQKGMLLLSAWEINRLCQGRFDEMIRRAMATCDDPRWQYASPEGWRLYRRSMPERSLVYSYELGWEILGHLLGTGWDQ